MEESKIQVYAQESQDNDRHRLCLIGPNVFVSVLL